MKVEFSRSSAAAQGVPARAVLNFVEAVERDGLGLHSLMVLRHGVVIAEGWWEPYGRELPHMLFSLSKSFTSTGAGLAAAEGLLSLEDKVVSFFPEDLPEAIGPNLAAMRVRDLLSMSTGHAEDTLGPVQRYGKGSWVANFLAQPVEFEPGTHFVYNSGATYMVSAILHKVTGQNLLEYLEPRLLGPLGITEATWESSPQGIATGGWGLNITTDDIARFGQLYLQKGVWQEQRLLSKAWVEEATSKQVSNGDDPNNDWAQGYGFQFWRCRHNAYRGDGAFGQYCVVLPEQDAVVAITSGTNDMGAILRHIWNILLPAMGDAPLAEDAAAQERLTQKLANLSLPLPVGNPTSPIGDAVSGKTYRFNSEGQEGNKVETATLLFQGDRATLTMRDQRGEHQLEIGRGKWLAGRTTLQIWSGTLLANNKTLENIGVSIAASGAWISADTYVAQVYFTTTPFNLTFTCHFSGDGIRVERKQNVAFGPTDFPVLEGKAE